MTLRIHHIALTKAQLDAIPAAERNLLVLIGHSANELAVLSKMFHFCCGGAPVKPILRHAFNVQAMLMGRLVTGKIFECWKLLEKAYFKTPLKQKYHSRLPQESREALDAMEAYFRNDNLIKRVRNKHAFHYDARQIADGHKTLGDNEPLDVYLAEIQANSLYAFADVIAGRALLECIFPGDPAKAMNMLIDDTSEAIGRINVGVGGLMATCFQMHIGGNLYSLGAKLVKITGAPSSQAIRIPYFIEVEKGRKNGKARKAK